MKCRKRKSPKKPPFKRAVENVQIVASDSF